MVEMERKEREGMSSGDVFEIRLTLERFNFNFNLDPFSFYLSSIKMMNEN